jgi:hypothetical protein
MLRHRNAVFGRVRPLDGVRTIIASGELTAAALVSPLSMLSQSKESHYLRK